ncbi:MAG: aldo/keto reductase [Deltaproteobacteria bacterium]|nr:aldo/keto reductase [Deltaproteobacteria bacterium]
MPKEANLVINSKEVPRIIYGTAWKEERTQECVLNALEAGFRAIDTANQRKHYYEHGVGEALMAAYAKGIVERKDVFLQTKFTFKAGQDSRLPYDPNAALRTQVMESFESSLSHLGTDYVDSYILHGPSSWDALNEEDWQVWRAMEELHQSGKAAILGVSNVSLPQLRELYSQAKVKPLFVQNRCYASRRWDKEVRDFCASQGIYYQAFSLLTANGWIIDHPEFQRVRKEANSTPAQLVFAFAMQIGMLPLTGTRNTAHMTEDLRANEIYLSTSQIDSLESLVQAR